PGGPRDLDQVNRVDDAGAASRRPPLYRLTVQEVGTHACRLVHEPGIEMHRRRPRVPLVTRDLVGRDERGDDLTQPPHRIAVRYEVVRVRLAVAAHVRAVAAPPIGPPAVALGIGVVPPPRAARPGERGRGDWTPPEVPP